ncbi:MAG: hypothetical protein AVDCRST_MAG77-6081 [uncultured Chloroflexi bacterium]|uniref:Cytidylate kinase-like family protein n=1 Tax=uncultured Chloroflexota bacterium TaxID=166587 RepID=A0A6J4KH40_9CHLR|nr:MAG: hypothetical protein AVDCRST_MAG77-6081 [uncultured Chloroflexota bacterium]
MAVITIARQLGSGGEQIAAELARRLGARLLDEGLLDYASQRTGIAREYFESFDERGRNMWRSPGDLVQLVPLPPIDPDLPDVFGDRYPPTGPVRARGEGLQSPRYWAAEAYAAALSRCIQAAAAEGDAVIVGRGGNEALAGAPRALNVLVVASEALRVRRIAEADRVDLYEAQDRVRQSDQRRRSYIRQFFGADWVDATRYDLVVRTDELSHEQAVEVIVTAVAPAARTAPTALPITPVTARVVPAHA